MKAEWRPSADWNAIEYRARMLRAIRAFFFARGVTEVETPLLSAAAATDPHLESFATRFRSQALYLNTSPEFAMKRMLAAWGRPVFQVCKAFRDDEVGPLHNPEFTLLEWYRPGLDMHALMDEIEQLVRHLLEALGPGARPKPDFRRVTYARLFDDIGLDAHHATPGGCEDFARGNGVEVPVGMESSDVDAWLDWLLTQCVLPSLPHESFTFIYEYPASQCALARITRDAGGREVASRFELLCGEVELGNGFEELLDAGEQRRRFERDNALRQQRGQQDMPPDQRLLGALEHGMPSSSGVAIGLDRLLMQFCGSAAIGEVVPFTIERA